MKISVSSYSFSQYINAGKMTQADVVERAAEMGFAGVEFTELTPCKNPTFEQQLEYAAQIRRRAAAAGIAIVNYAVGADLFRQPGADAQQEVERLCRQVDIARALGAPGMRHDVCYSQKLGERVYPFGAMLPILAENIRRVADYAASVGVRTCSENHGYVAQDSDRVEALLAAANHPNYGLLLDIGNFACADEDNACAVSRLAPLAIHVHVKDFRITPNGAPQPAQSFPSRACRHLEGCAIGDGDIPVLQCLSILRRVGYDRWLSVEYEGAGDCMEGIARGRNFLRQALGL